MCIMTLKKLLAAVIASLFGGTVVLWMIGSQLSAPAPSSVGFPPKTQPFEVVSAAGIHGWYIQGNSRQPCILLMHSVGSSRIEMMSRAVLFKKHGFSAFTIDLQAHGENKGDKITFGYQESKNARDAVKFLRSEKNCRNIVALGRSLGGASALLGIEPLQVEGYILEAVYPGIEKAVKNRLTMRLGELGGLIAPLLYQQIPLRFNINLRQLQPAEAVKNIISPVLIINGTADNHTTKEDALALFNNAPEPKQLLLIEGAGHTNLFDYNPELYREGVIKFLGELKD